ncbi:hypothetical protein, partial [Vibrio sp. RE86]|uniref:hypothetical protein n=1 Tax=Vibrio sp. RE86 TaxID=2607605 RepID=UPI001C10C816
LALIVITSIASFSATAASVKVRWTGQVPTVDCATQTISNQVAFNEQNERCKIELTQHESKIHTTKKENKMVSFDV